MADEERFDEILDRLRDVGASLRRGRSRKARLVGDLGMFVAVGALGIAVLGTSRWPWLLAGAVVTAKLLNRGVGSLIRLLLQHERRRLIVQLRPVARRLLHRASPETRPGRMDTFRERDQSAFAREFERLAYLLPGEEATVVRLHHGLHGAEPMTLWEIGALLGSSPLRVDEILKRGMDKIRKGFGDGGAGCPAWLYPPDPGPLFQAEHPPTSGNEDPWDEEGGNGPTGTPVSS